MVAPVVHPAQFSLLLGSKLRLLAPELSFGTCNRHPFTGAHTDQVSLKRCEGRHDVEKHLPHRVCRVVHACAEGKLYPAFYQRIRNIARVRNRTREGHAAYRNRFEMVYRHRAERPNAVWQADHTECDILFLDSNGAPVRPWLTTVIDDHSGRRGLHGVSRRGFIVTNGARPAAGDLAKIWIGNGPSAACPMRSMSITAAISPAHILIKLQRTCISESSTRLSVRHPPLIPDSPLLEVFCEQLLNSVANQRWIRRPYNVCTGHLSPRPP
ncbi:hypothetical protein, partial [Xanthomonas populi]|uniref:hypothetical protein n=1 Tax=Xanthomonas populi TaxID=53414 RepID=UPI003CCDD787